MSYTISDTWTRGERLALIEAIAGQARGRLREAPLSITPSEQFALFERILFAAGMSDLFCENNRDRIIGDAPVMPPWIAAPDDIEVQS